MTRQSKIAVLGPFWLCHSVTTDCSADKRIQNAEAAAQAADKQRGEAEAHAQYCQQQLEEQLAAQKASAAKMSAEFMRLKCELSQSQERCTTLSAQAARDHELLQRENAGLVGDNALQADELQQSKATQAELGSTVQEMAAKMKGYNRPLPLFQPPIHKFKLIWTTLMRASKQ